MVVRFVDFVWSGLCPVFCLGLRARPFINWKKLITLTLNLIVIMLLIFVLCSFSRCANQPPTYLQHYPANDGSRCNRLRALAAEVTRVTLEVGSQGKLGGQAYVPDVEGVWYELVRNVSSTRIYLIGRDIGFPYLTLI